MNSITTSWQYWHRSRTDSFIVYPPFHWKQSRFWNNFQPNYSVPNTQVPL